MSKIVLEDFNKGDGYYKVNLAYLSKEQVEEIEALVSKWSPTDEDIKSCIGMCLTDVNEQRFKDYGTNLKDCLAWLKRQGIKPQGKTALEAIHEQRSDNANKVERKFKVGDFIVNDYCKGKVIELTTDAYLLDTEQGIPFSCEHNAHLWSIQDANDGDVLAAHECYVIFKEIDGLNIKCYCTYHYMGFNPSFYVDTLQNKTAFCPATKEQKDFLFKRMEEEGYKWDDEHKELKKIETTDTYCKENCKGYQETGKCYADGSCDAKIKAEQNSSWTEEDERNLQNIDSVLFREISLSEDECMRLRDWLKSLKERAVWKPSKEQIQSLNEAVGIVGLFTPRGSYLKSLSEQLKKL